MKFRSQPEQLIRTLAMTYAIDNADRSTSLRNDKESRQLKIKLGDVLHFKGGPITGDGECIQYHYNFIHLNGNVKIFFK